MRWADYANCRRLSTLRSRQQLPADAATEGFRPSFVDAPDEHEHTRNHAEPEYEGQIQATKTSSSLGPGRHDESRRHGGRQEHPLGSTASSVLSSWRSALHQKGGQPALAHYDAAPPDHEH